jgi:hypothetical protein
MGQDDRAHVGRRPADLGERRLDLRPGSGPARVDHGDLAAVDDQVPVDQPVGDAMDPGSDLGGERHQGVRFGRVRAGSCAFIPTPYPSAPFACRSFAMRLGEL